MKVFVNIRRFAHTIHKVRKEKTTQYKLQEAVRLLSSRNEAILASVPNIIMEVDNNKIYTWANSAGYEFFGDDVIGKEADYYFEGEQETYKIVDPLFDGSGDKIYVESWQRRKDGEKRLLAWWCKVLRNEKGAVTGVLSSAYDITEHRRAEAEIINKNRVYAVISQINQMVVRTREKDKILSEACRIAIETGKFRMAWIGKLDEKEQTVEPVACEGVEKGYLASIKKISVPHDSECYSPTGIAIREGKYFCSNDIAKDPCIAPCRDEALKRGYRSSIAIPIIIRGKIFGVFTIYASEPFFFSKSEINLLNEVTENIAYANEMIDIEEQRKKAEQKLNELADIVKFSDDAIIGKTLDGIIISWNRGAEIIYGYTESEVIGKPIKILIPPEQENEVPRILEKIKSGEHIEHYEAVRQTKDGRKIQMSLTISPVRDSEGKIITASTIAHDITERKKAENELLRAKDMAEESDRLKTAFLHNISHEIRTPLNAIVGFSALLGEPDLNESSKQSFIDTITQSSNQLLAIINDIIEISNIEAGILKFSKDEININQVLQRLFNQFTQQANEKSIRFIKDTPLSDTEAVIISDNTKIIEILSNLLSNAFKFTAEGTIRFGYKVENQLITFFVSDTGTGIPQDQFKKIFDRFYQVEHTLDRQYEGTGLGLSISKAYVELLGGKIWFESQYEKGSVFYFNLPFDDQHKIVKHEPAIVPDLDFKKPVSILVAEDDEYNYMLIKKYLEKPNLNLVRAKNGLEAVKYCQSVKNIDIILMDLKMPEMDGYEATQKIRKILPAIPVIAQTAYATDKEKAFKSGCDDIITKPFKQSDLLELIKKYLKQ